ncbi:MAG TPA: hypothetical protein PK595_06825 [Bacteroidota bacterium]|nr:hypothetical protein [Bacteroidota bacterium]
MIKEIIDELNSTINKILLMQFEEQNIGVVRILHRCADNIQDVINGLALYEHIKKSNSGDGNDNNNLQ